MSAQRRAIFADYVIPVDPERRVIENGAVLTEGKRIEAVSSAEKIRRDYPGAEVIDLGHSVILPGLIDSHSHAGHGYTKDFFGSRGTWLQEARRVYFEGSGEDYWRMEGYLNALERLTFGVTTATTFIGSMSRIDDPKFALASAEGSVEFGLRQLLAVGPPSSPFPHECYDPDTGTRTELTLDRSLELTDKVLEAIDDEYGERIRGYVGPHTLVPELETGDESAGTVGAAHGDAPDTVENATATPESVRLLEGIHELSEKYDAPIHAHGFGGMVLAAHDAVPEVLSPKLSLAHCTGMNDREFELMSERGVSASHGPMTSAHVRSPFRLVEAKEAGVNVAVSTDASAPDRSFDLLSKGRIAAHLQRTRFGDTSLIPAGSVLEMLTIDAARSVDLADELGSLEPGKLADLIGINLDAAHLRPRFTIVPRVVNYAMGQDVEFVMVNGEILYEDGAVGTIDKDEILEEADKLSVEAIERIGNTEGLEPHPDEWGSLRYEN